jgi:thymidylate synthase (FAD)
MQNQIELIGHYASDTQIAQAAWVSTNSELTPDRAERVPEFVRKLWQQGHETPFERGILHFVVTAEIASHIHFLKHRIGVSINSQSARYMELKADEFYIPSDWANIPAASLSGADRKQFGNTWAEVLENFSKLSNYFYHAALSDLAPTLGKPRAKESARYFKMYNSQIKSDVLFNLRSFAHFLELRHDEHAQLEIREIASEMLRQVCQIPGDPFGAAIDAIMEKRAAKQDLKMLAPKLEALVEELERQDGEQPELLTRILYAMQNI